MVGISKLSRGRKTKYNSMQISILHVGRASKSVIEINFYTGKIFTGK
jgi:hypothetical protein